MDVVVVGASNTDLTSYVTRLPVPGETIHGSVFKVGFGGKGANQCMMAAKLKATTAMITMLGNDSFGKDTLENFLSHGINAEFVFTTSEAATGVAPIAVDQSGQNSIIIINGANDYLSPALVDTASAVISSAKVLLTQLEIKGETTLRALEIASKAGIVSIFNPAPATPSLASSFYTLPTIFCLNETEAQMLTGVAVVDVPSAKAACQVLQERGCQTILVTLGAKGAFALGRDEEFFVPAEVVEVVDTSGAGDAFLDAVTRSCHIASVSVQRQGTQSSYPSREALPAHLFQYP